MYTIPGGSLLTGFRDPSNFAWTISDKLPRNACLPFVAYQLYSLDDRFRAGQCARRSVTLEEGRSAMPVISGGKDLAFALQPADHVELGALVC